MLLALCSVWPAVWLSTLQAADPVPPKRIDPAAMPGEPAASPTMPNDGRPVVSQDADAQTPAEPAPPTETGPRPLRTRRAPSVFTDEAYRHARVRSLLMRAYEQRL